MRMFSSARQLRISGTPVTRSLLALTGGLVGLIWCGVLAGLIFIDSTDETAEAVADVVHAVATESAEVTDRYLGESEVSAAMTVRAVIDSDGDTSSRLVETTLQNIVASHASVDGVFFGKPNGDFYYVTHLSLIHI